MLNCTKILTTLAQYETEFNGVFGPLIKHTLMTSLCFNSVYVIETTRVTKIPNVPLRYKPVSGISDIGKDTLCWTQLESK